MENMTMGLITTVIGLVIVFVVLGLLTLVLYLLKYAAPKNGADNKQEIPNKNTDAKKKPEIEQENLMNDNELVAVITAAIAAYLPSSSSSFVVRSIRRTEAWNAVARREHTLQKVGRLERKM